jgi:hypothetical protein
LRSRNSFGAACSNEKLQAVGQCKDDLRSMGHAELFFGPGQLPPELGIGFCVDTRGQAFVGGLATTLMYGIEMERGRRPKNYVRKAAYIFAGGCMRRGTALGTLVLAALSAWEPAWGGGIIIPDGRPRCVVQHFMHECPKAFKGTLSVRN